MAQKQTMIQAQPASAEIIAELGKQYGGKSKSRDFMPLTQWETIAALLAFFEAYRWVETGETETNEETGEETPVLADAFKPYADELLSLRMETTRASSAKDLAELKASLRKELEEMGMSGEKLESILAKYGAA